MSNCIEIYDDIMLSPETFDIPRFLADMKQHAYVNEPGFKKHFAPEATNSEFIFYWFLSPSNVFLMDSGMLFIRFGDHRSGHTNRDFRATENFLSQYLLVDKLRWRVKMADECDGFKWFWDYVELKKPVEV